MSVKFEAKLLVDQATAVKFVSFFLDRSPKSYEACTFLASDIEEPGGLKLFHIETQCGLPEPLFSKNFRFSGRVFIYHEDLFTPEQAGEWHRLYEKNNMFLELRGQDYLQLESLRREAAHATAKP